MSIGLFSSRSFVTVSGKTAFDWAQHSQNPACINVLSDSYHIGPRGTTKISNNIRHRATSQVRGGPIDGSQTEALPSSSDGKKRFEELFSGKKSLQPQQSDNQNQQDLAVPAQSTPAAKYKSYDAESNTSRLESEDKSPQIISSRHKSSKVNSWASDSDSLNDIDVAQTAATATEVKCLKL